MTDTAQRIDPIRFEADTTLRWSCRQGDYVLWLRCKGLSSVTGKHFDIAVFWELKDGDFLTITNRQADLPAWFQLYPTEVHGHLACYRMMEKVNKGYRPKEIMDGPNLWRLFSGDRLVWLGKRRHDLPSNGGVLTLLDLRENALVIGESTRRDCDPTLFGAPSSSQPTPEQSELIRVGVDAVNQLGMPRTLTADGKWTIGS